MSSVTCRALLPPACASWARDALLLEAALGEEAGPLVSEDAGAAAAAPALLEAPLLGAMPAETQEGDWKSLVEDARATQLRMYANANEKSF